MSARCNACRSRRSRCRHGLVLVELASRVTILSIADGANEGRRRGVCALYALPWCRERAHIALGRSKYCARAVEGVQRDRERTKAARQHTLTRTAQRIATGAVYRGKRATARRMARKLGQEGRRERERVAEGERGRRRGVEHGQGGTSWSRDGAYGETAAGGSRGGSSTSPASVGVLASEESAGRRETESGERAWCVIDLVVACRSDRGA